MNRAVIECKRQLIGCRIARRLCNGDRRLVVSSRKRNIRIRIYVPGRIQRWSGIVFDSSINYYRSARPCDNIISQLTKEMRRSVGEIHVNNFLDPVANLGGTCFDVHFAFCNVCALLVVDILLTPHPCIPLPGMLSFCPVTVDIRLIFIPPTSAESLESGIVNRHYRFVFHKPAVNLSWRSKVFGVYCSS